jgi:hypothetical protein
LPEKVEILYNNIGDNLLIYSNSILIDESGNELGRNKFRKMLPARNDPRAFSIRNTVAGHTVLFRKDLLDIALPIPNHCYYDWWMALVAANEGKITNRNLSLTKHRIHTSNASRGRELPQEEEYASMQQWIRSVLSLKNLRYREFFEELLRIFILEGTARDKALIRFQIKNNKIIYAKKSFFSRINSARKIGLSVMPAK